VLTFTFPNATFVVLALRPASEPPRFNVIDCDTPPALAVSVAVCAVLTALTVAVKLALVAPEATVTAVGTVTALSLLAKPTEIPPLPAALLKVTAQLSVAGPVKELLAQLNPLKVGAFKVGTLAAAPVPLRLTVIWPSVAELFVMLSCPLALPTAVGAKITLRLKVAPAATAIGKSPAPLTENDCPEMLTLVICTGAVP